MMLPKQIRHQIKEWIRTDAKCVRLEAKINTLKQKQRRYWEQFRSQQQADHWKMFRELRRIDDFRTSILERRKQTTRIARAHTRTLARQSRELRRNLSQLDTKLLLAVNALGTRRGFLRKDLADRFLKLAAREAARRCKV